MFDVALVDGVITLEDAFALRGAALYDRDITTELLKAESADNLKVSEIADAGIYSSMLLMSSMGSFEGELLRVDGV